MTHNITAQDFINKFSGLNAGTILADPPWQFQNRTGKVAPEHRRLSRYETMTLQDIKAIPASVAASENAHLYLWVPNALLAEGLEVMKPGGFNIKPILYGTKSAKTGDQTVAG